MGIIPTTTWNLTTIGGIEYLVVDAAQFRIPLDFDPSSNMFIAVASPTGGLGNFPALVQGDPGPPPTIDTTINVTFLAPDDVTANSATWTETSPDVYKLNLVIHTGPQGDPGDTVLDLDDFTGTPLAGKILVVNPAVDGLQYETLKVGDRYVPATILSTPSGNAAYTLCAVSIPAQDFDWRPEVAGQCVITGTDYNVRVDLVARLDAGLGGTPEISGNIVGRGFGTPYWVLLPQNTVLSSGPPANASATYDKVAAGVNAVVYLRAERIAGVATFTTAGDQTTFCVWVRPIP